MCSEISVSVPLKLHFLYQHNTDKFSPTCKLEKMITTNKAKTVKDNIEMIFLNFLPMTTKA